MKRKDGICFISTEHTMAAEQNRMEERLTADERFRKKARVIIDKMTELDSITQGDTSDLVDEILHSIFFLAKIHKEPISPESILKDMPQLLEDLKSRFPRPFQLYFSQLPRRSPFSCVLDMMVRLVGQENEDEIRHRLQEFITEVEGGAPSGDLTSKAICVSQKSNSSVRHYGVSMSTSTQFTKAIMIAASCLSAWDDYVAGAVMTYYPKKFKEYFDGTIKIPKDVRCQTFDLGNGVKKNPCKSCSNLFGMNTDKTKPCLPYGNCAEAESLSKLLQTDREVKEQSRPTSDKWTPENRNRAREEVIQKLKARLSSISFQWDVPIFTPQGTRV